MSASTVMDLPTGVINSADTIRRVFDAAVINPIVNHPAVRPWVAAIPHGDIDLTDALADERNVLLMIDGGGIFFAQLFPGIYEAHTQFLPSVRGPAAMSATREAIHWMFTRTDAMEILTKVPQHNRAADLWARASGGTLDFERADAWQTEAGLVSVRYYALRYADWVRKAAGLVEKGAWFHDHLEAEKTRIGSRNAVHGDDPAHDRHVGAAVEMIMAGQVIKGVSLYNRWAAFAGYVPIGVVSFDPLTIDIGEALIRITGATFEVLPCQ